MFPLLQHRTAVLVVLAAGSAVLYGVLASAGDLRERIALYLVLHAVLFAAMLAAWLVLSRAEAARGVVLAAACGFRAIAVAAEPTLSDDVHRYVWDGRVQASGFHPYRLTPLDPALAGLRDESASRINHPELRTIYPPGAQAAFAGLALAGAGPRGFKLAMAAADVAVILALGGLLRRLGRPAHLVVLYAWNPLAVMESAASGHVESLGVVLMLIAVRWIIEGRDRLSTLALALAIHVKLVPAVLLPICARRFGRGAWLSLAVALAVPWIPYALTGPALGAGLAAYAERWEHNAFGYAVLELALERLHCERALTPWIDGAREVLGGPERVWRSLYRAVWPRELARLAVAAVAAVWLVVLGARRSGGLAEKSLCALGGVLLLSPTLHPWYLLWVLPFAAACRSWGFVLFSATVPLAYTAGTGDVAWGFRAVEYLPVFALLAWELRARCKRIDPPARAG
jgi:hypothetical protein